MAKRDLKNVAIPNEITNHNYTRSYTGEILVAFICLLIGMAIVWNVAANALTEVNISVKDFINGVLNISAVFFGLAVLFGLGRIYSSVVNSIGNEVHQRELELRRLDNETLKIRLSLTQAGNDDAGIMEPIVDKPVGRLIQLIALDVFDNGEFTRANKNPWARRNAAKIAQGVGMGLLKDDNPVITKTIDWLKDNEVIIVVEGTTKSYKWNTETYKNMYSVTKKLKVGVKLDYPPAP